MDKYGCGQRQTIQEIGNYEKSRDTMISLKMFKYKLNSYFLKNHP